MSDPVSHGTADRFGGGAFSRDPAQEFMKDMEREFFGSFGLRSPGLFDRDPFSDERNMQGGGLDRYSGDFGRPHAHERFRQHTQQ